MAAIPNTIGLTGAIAPIDSNDTYFTHYAQYGLGGFYAVADITARDNISPLRLEDGLLVKVLSDGKYYTYSTGVWTEEAFGGSSLTYEVKNADFTAAPNYIYGVDTTAGVVVATLPVGVAGDQIHFTDARYTFGTNKLTLNAASGETIAGLASIDLDRHRDTISLVYDAVANDWVIWGTEASNSTGGNSDQLIRISSSDTTSGYLQSKLVQGTGVTLTKNNSGGNETITIEATTSGAGDPYRIINGTSEAGFYTSGGKFQLKFSGSNYMLVSDDNFSYGANAISTSILGLGNVALGHGNLQNTTTGSYNLALLQSSLQFNTSGDHNIALGQLTLNSNTVGTYNIAVGAEALKLNSTGSSNVAIGVSSLLGSVSGVSNVAVGSYSLRQLMSGNYNTAIGSDAAYNMTSGTGNVAIGASTLNVNAGGVGNVAVGGACLSANTTGGYNVAIGSYSHSTNTSGSFNVAIGRNAGQGPLSASSCVFIGDGAGTTAGNTGDNNICIGLNALQSSTISSNEITLGNSSITALRCQVTSITSLSDQRDKTDITTLPLGLNFINSLNPVIYRWDKREWYEDGVRDGSKKEDKLNAGFLAQDLQQSQSDFEADYLKLVYDTNPDKLEATPGNLLFVLVQAVKELSAEVSDLKAELQSVKSTKTTRKSKTAPTI